MELRDVYYLNGVRFESSEPIQVTLTQGDCVSTLELSLDEEEVPPFFKNMKIEMSVEPVERKDGFPLFSDDTTVNKILYHNGASVDEDTGNLCRVSRKVKELATKDKGFLYLVAEELKSRKIERIHLQDLNDLFSMRTSDDTVDFSLALSNKVFIYDDYQNGYLIESYFIKLKPEWFEA